MSLFPTNTQTLNHLEKEIQVKQVVSGEIGVIDQICVYSKDNNGTCQGQVTMSSSKQKSRNCLPSYMISKAGLNIGAELHVT